MTEKQMLALCPSAIPTQEDLSFINGFPPAVPRRYRPGAEDQHGMEKLATSVLATGIADEDVDWVMEGGDINRPGTFRFWCWLAGWKTEEVIQRGRRGIIERWAAAGKITPYRAEVLMFQLASQAASQAAREGVPSGGSGVGVASPAQPVHPGLQG